MLRATSGGSNDKKCLVALSLGTFRLENPMPGPEPFRFGVTKNESDPITNRPGWRLNRSSHSDAILPKLNNLLYIGALPPTTRRLTYRFEYSSISLPIKLGVIEPNGSDPPCAHTILVFRLCSSNRRKGPIVGGNCGGLSPSLKRAGVGMALAAASIWKLARRISQLRRQAP